MCAENALPASPDDLRISIVTPCLNQAKFLESCIRSVLDQGYGNLEYIIVDGGSTDGSVDIIKRYADRLHYWVSVPDGGQYSAINQGFAHSTGEIMAWLNADDQYMPWSLSIVSDIFARFENVEWLTSAYQIIWDEQGRAVHCSRESDYSRRAFRRGVYLPGNPGFHRAGIQQESTFWRRSLWERAGGSLDARLDLAGDFELWARFYRYAELYCVSTPLGGFRRHGEQKTATRAVDYHKEAAAALARYGGQPLGRASSAFWYGLFGAGRMVRRWLNLLLDRARPQEHIRWTRGRPGKWVKRRL
jgi:glycosyltransferase involved in cell wall biosynthesis